MPAGLGGYLKLYLTTFSLVAVGATGQVTSNDGEQGIHVVWYPTFVECALL